LISPAATPPDGSPTLDSTVKMSLPQGL
jgi:hypothetical protein